MPWGKHDDKFHRNRKVKPLRNSMRGLAALGLRSLLHSECLDDPQLDGRIQAFDLRSKKEKELCDALVGAGLLDRDGDDYVFHDWADYNPTKTGLSQARNKTRERVTKHREQKRNDGVTALHGDSNALQKRDSTVTLTRTRTQPPSRTHSAPSGAVASPSGRRPPARTADNREAWDSYSAAYDARYGEPPTRNAKTNGQIAQFVRRVPVGEAPAIAAFFVGLNKRWYVERGHSLDCLVADAESLRTQWATGRTVTSHAAREADRRQGRGQEYEDLGKRLDAEVAR